MTIFYLRAVSRAVSSVQSSRRHPSSVGFDINSDLIYIIVDKRYYYLALQALPIMRT